MIVVVLSCFSFVIWIKVSDTRWYHFEESDSTTYCIRDTLIEEEFICKYMD